MRSYLKIQDKTKSEQVKALVESMRSQLVSPSDQVIADFFGVNRSTVQRWKKATTKVRDTDLLIRKLGCKSEVFEQLIRKELDVLVFLEVHAPSWKSYLSEYAEVDKFISQMLPRTNLVNVAKILQAVTEIASNHLLTQIVGQSESEPETIQDLISLGMKSRKWRIERNGLERFAESASISVQRIKDIWLGGRPDMGELVKLAAILGKSTEELIDLRDRQYGENGDTLNKERAAS
jgi:transcriptional regulator with XRE-family HTH domain